MARCGPRKRMQVPSAPPQPEPPIPSRARQQAAVTGAGSLTFNRADLPRRTLSPHPFRTSQYPWNMNQDKANEPPIPFDSGPVEDEETAAAADQLFALLDAEEDCK